uniref:Uncharacterized protein n=1 Tax=Panagrolaimus sp. PS1159 TaxID=55785 RepID=A0AC35FK75_9BILA
MYEAALNEYCKAINYANNLQDDNPKKLQLIYEADFGYLEILCEVDKSRILEVLNVFMLKYPIHDQQLDLIKKQNSSHLIAHCYILGNNYFYPKFLVTYT